MSFQAAVTIQRHQDKITAITLPHNLIAAIPSKYGF